MELRLDVILYSKLVNKNSDAAHIKCFTGLHLSQGLKVPHPCFRSFGQYLNLYSKRNVNLKKNLQSGFAMFVKPKNMAMFHNLKQNVL